MGEELCEVEAIGERNRYVCSPAYTNRRVRMLDDVGVICYWHGVGESIMLPRIET